MDVEKVSLRHLTGISRLRAGIVGVVNILGKKLYHEKVYCKPGSFLDGPKDIKINGIKRYDLTGGKELATITDQLKNLLKDKVIITVNGEHEWEVEKIIKIRRLK